MLDQVIYTRCFPARDLIHGGEVLYLDGYGTFSMSPGIFSRTDEKDREFLRERFADYNGAKEGAPQGLFRSYEYVELPGGQHALISLVVKAKEETKGLVRGMSANGAVSSIRINPYVEQAFVGTFRDYPMYWFGCGDWDAHLAPVLDFYMDGAPDPAPPFLAQKDDVPKGRKLTREQIRAFVRGGREEAVKACVWFLLQEAEKPADQRKVLLIRDTPEQVELWIAAVSSCVSAELAAGITFSTNRSNLNINIETVLFDCALSEASSRRGAAKKPLFMIVGFHPQDAMCSSVRQTAASRFVLLDGAARKLGTEPDGTIGRAYFRDMVEMSDDIRDFCEIVLPSIPLKRLSAKIPELYDAYKYLLDSSHTEDSWSYDDALRHLECISQFGLFENEVLVDYILDGFFKVYGTRFFTADAKAGYPLLKLLSRYAEKAGREAAVTDILEDVLRGLLGDLRGNGGKLAAAWSLMRGMEPSVLCPVLDGIFTGGRISSCAEQFPFCAPEAVEAVVEMYLAALSGKDGGTAPDFGELICGAVGAVSRDRDALYQILDALAEYDAGMPGPAVLLTMSRTDAGGEENLRDALLDYEQEDLGEICTLAEKYNLEPQRIEAVLAREVERAGECTQEAEDAFDGMIKRRGGYPGAGLAFFKAWADVSDPGSFPSLIDAVQACRPDQEVQKKLFKMLDERITLETAVKGGVLLKKMDDWGRTLAGRLRSKSGVLIEIYRKLMQANTEEEALCMLERYTTQPLYEDEKFFESEYFRKLSWSAGRFYSGYVNLAVLSLFRTRDDRAMKKYVDCYVGTLLDGEKIKGLARIMVSLCYTIKIELKVNGVNEEYADRVCRILRDSFEQVLPDYYKPGLYDEVRRIGGTDRRVEEYLLDLLEQAEEKRRSGGGLRGFLEKGRKGLGGLFGKKG